MLGLDSAGKTTILYKLHIGEILSTVPTIGTPPEIYSRVMQDDVSQPVEWTCAVVRVTPHRQQGLCIAGVR